MNELNDYFCGITSTNNINTDLCELYAEEKEFTYDGFKFVEITEEDVYSALTNISSNSVGNDGISIKFIKIIFREIKYILCHIFNYSIRNSVYPSVWKRALVITLPKVANPTETKHYRPINILCE